MKLGLLFTGISYGYYGISAGATDGRTGTELLRDYSHCFPNININLIEPFKENNDVKIYLTSYHNDREQDIIHKYCPTLYSFIEMKNSNQILTYIKSLEQIRNQDLDFVISTRFDIHFNQKVTDLNIDYNKFNCLFKEKGFWERLQFTTDNLFAFKYSMLDSFINALHIIHKMPRIQTDLHPVFYEVQKGIGASNTHFISEIDELSHANSIYKLCGGRHSVVET